MAQRGKANMEGHNANRGERRRKSNMANMVHGRKVDHTRYGVDSTRFRPDSTFEHGHNFDQHEREDESYVNELRPNADCQRLIGHHRRDAS